LKVPAGAARIFKGDVSEAEPRVMQGSDEGHRSGKSAKGTNREARLAVKLRQNLVRRKEKARAAGRAADFAAAPSSAAMSTLPGDDDQGE
jgi:hypothetical protein